MGIISENFKQIEPEFSGYVKGSFQPDRRGYQFITYPSPRPPIAHDNVYCRQREEVVLIFLKRLTPPRIRMK